MYTKGWLFLVLVFIFPSLFAAEKFESTAEFSVCFTPGENCTQHIVDAIHEAVGNIWVQAYSFTAKPIEEALIDAKDRGVNVHVVVDKSVLTNPKNVAEFLAQHQIPVWVDYQPGIAHNKVMIIDQTRVITGSFNFTKAAQNRNAENLLIIDDAGLAQKYLDNWHRRQHVSRAYQPVGEEKIVVPVIPEHPTFLGWLQQLWEMIKEFFHSPTKRLQIN